MSTSSIFTNFGHDAMVNSMTTRNPQWPIHADYVAYGLPNGSDTSLVTDKEVVADFYDSGNMEYGFWDSYTKSPMNDALGKALAKTKTEAQVVAACKTILEQYPECIEAYVILGSSVETYEDALDAFQKGEVMAKKLAGPEKLKQCLKTNIFMYPELRPLWACMACVANTLRKMGHYEEALLKFNELATLDHDNSTQSSSDYINIIPMATDCLLALGRFDECERFFNLFSHKFATQSSSNIRLFNLLLIEWNKKKRFSDSTLSYAGGSNEYIWEYLLGRPLPNTPGGRHMRWQGSLSNAVLYVNNFWKHWKIVPGALAAIKIWAVRSKLNRFVNVPENDKLVRSFREFLGRAKAQGVTWNQLLINGEDMEAKIPPRCVHVAHELCGFNSHRLLETLLEMYKDTMDLQVQRTGNEAPLHPAAFFGSTECVEVLLKYGAKLEVWDALGRTPIHNAANQMEHVILKRLLEVAPKMIKIRREQSGNTPLHSFINSSVIDCLLSKRKCQRCESGQIGHSRTADPIKTLQVLLDFGAAQGSLQLDLLGTLIQYDILHPLYFAAIRHPRVDPDHVDGNGKFPLIDIALLAKQRSEMPLLSKCLKYMLAYRSGDLRKERKYKGKTPAQYFQLAGWQEAVELLKKDPKELQQELEAAEKTLASESANSGSAPQHKESREEAIWNRAMSLKQAAAAQFSAGNYKKAIAEYSNSVEALNEAASVAKDRDFRLKIDLEVDRLSNNKAICAFKLGQYEDCLLFAQAALSGDPKWAKPYYYKSMALFELKRAAESLVVVEEAMKLSMDAQTRKSFEELHKKVKVAAYEGIDEVD